jgi:hypothetical protein
VPGYGQRSFWGAVVVGVGLDRTGRRVGRFGGRRGLGRRRGRSVSRVVVVVSGALVLVMVGIAGSSTATKTRDADARQPEPWHDVSSVHWPDTLLIAHGTQRDRTVNRPSAESPGHAV